MEADYLSLCRVCLETSFQYIDLESPVEFTESDSGKTINLTFMDCYRECTRLDIKEDQGTRVICVTCCVELKIAYNFLKRAETASKFFQQFAKGSICETEEYEVEEENIKCFEIEDVGEPTDALDEAEVHFNDIKRADDEDFVVDVLDSSDPAFDKVDFEKTVKVVIENSVINSDQPQDYKDDIQIDTDANNFTHQDYKFDEDYDQIETDADNEQPQDNKFDKDDVQIDTEDAYEFDIENNENSNDQPLDYKLDIDDVQSEHKQLGLEEQINLDEENPDTDIEDNEGEHKQLGLGEQINLETDTPQSVHSYFKQKRKRKTLGLKENVIDHVDSPNLTSDEEVDQIDGEDPVETASESRKKTKDQPSKIYPPKRSNYNRKPKPKELKGFIINRNYCKICFEKLDGLSLAEHLDKFHDQKKQCSVCEYVDKEFLVMEHEKFAHNLQHGYQCKTCNKTYKTIYALQRHLEGYEKKPDPCKICGKQYKLEESLKRHLLQHESKKICTLCSETIEDGNLEGHLEQSHGEIIQCRYCKYKDKEYKVRKHVKIHYRKETESRTFLCDFCPKILRSKASFNLHMKGHENKEQNPKSEACKICGKRFSDPGYLRNHMKVHSKERPTYKCNLCDKSYSKYRLKMHMRFHEGKTIECLECGKLFVALSELKIHMRFHTGEFPFECEKCDKKFAVKGHLRTHIAAIHEGFRFECKICEKTFMHRTALRSHSFLHSRMPFPCNYCSKEYPTKYTYKIHLKTGHSINLSNEEFEKLKPITKSKVEVNKS